MKTLICNGTLVTPDGEIQADMLLENGGIAAIGQNLPREGAEMEDASGKYVFPGGIDAHTHISLDLDAVKDADVFYHGTIPAAVGGTTTIVDHLAFAPVGRSLGEQMAKYRELSAGRPAVDYALHAVAQDMSAATREELARLPRQGVSSVKAYMTYAQRLDDSRMLQLLQYCKDLDLLPAIHAEDHACVSGRVAAFKAEGKGEAIWHARSRPAECESKAIERVLHMAAQAGDLPLYIVHLSTASGLEAIRKARAAGQRNIFVETCTQYLLLDEQRYADPCEGLKYIMSPPLRSPRDNEALWQGLRDGDIQTVATDHCSFSLADKEKGRGDFTRCPGGAPGLEERFLLLFSEGVVKGRLSAVRFAEVIAANPAKLMGLYPAKGALRIGADADVVILDPGPRHTLAAADLHGPGDYSLFEGMEVQGGIASVYLRGEAVARNGRFLGSRGRGAYLQRARYRQAR